MAVNKILRLYSNCLGDYSNIGENTDIKYVTLGHFDWLTLSEYSEGVEFSSLLNDDNDSDNDIFNKYTKYTVSLHHHSEEQDQKFWKRGMPPYIIATFVSVNSSHKNNYSGICSYIEAIETSNSETSSQIAYHTLESWDIVIFTKADTYLSALELLLPIIRKQDFVAYSYSITGYSHKLLEEKKFPENEVLPQVQIFITLGMNEDNRCSFSVDQIMSAFNELASPNGAVKTTWVTGEHDIEIHCTAVEGKQFWKWFCEKYTSGSFYRDNHIRRIKTKILTPTEALDNSAITISCYESKPKVEIMDMIRRSYDVYMDNSQRFDKYEILHKNVRRVIYEIIRMLTQNEKRNYDGFAFMNLAQSILAFIYIYCNQTSVDKEEDLTLELYARIFDFINSLYMNLQVSSKTDRNFFEPYNFHINVYDIPHKLEGYLAAYCLKMIKLLKKIDSAVKIDEKESGDGTTSGIESHNSVFISPEMVTGIQTENVFDGSPHDDHLLIIHIPQQNIFTPSQLMPQLAHEISHVVGSRLRNRDERNGYWLKAIISTSVSALMNPFGILSEDVEKELFINLNRLIFQDAKNEYEKYMRKNGDVAYRAEAQRHMLSTIAMKTIGNISTREALYRSIVSILYNTLHESTAEKLEKQISELSKNNVEVDKALTDIGRDDKNWYLAQKLVAILERVANEMLSKEHPNKKADDDGETHYFSFDFQNITQSLYELIDESYSDILSINILKLNFNQYIETFWKTNRMDFQFISRQNYWIRVALITKVMGDRYINAVSNTIHNFENLDKEEDHIKPLYTCDSFSYDTDSEDGATHSVERTDKEEQQQSQVSNDWNNFLYDTACKVDGYLKYIDGKLPYEVVKKASDNPKPEGSAEKAQQKGIPYILQSTEAFKEIACYLGMVKKNLDKAFKEDDVGVRQGALAKSLTIFRKSDHIAMVKEIEDEIFRYRTELPKSIELLHKKYSDLKLVRSGKIETRNYMVSLQVFANEDSADTV